METKSILSSKIYQKLFTDLYNLVLLDDLCEIFEISCKSTAIVWAKKLKLVRDIDYFSEVMKFKGKNSGTYLVKPNNLNSNEENIKRFKQLYPITPDSELVKIFKISRKLVNSEAKRLQCDTRDPSVVKNHKRKIATENSRKSRYKLSKISTDERKQRENYFNLSNWTGPVLKYINTKNELELLKEFGIFNPKTNINGLVRDHKYSRDSGFNTKVLPIILKHPVNCELISYKENLKKARTYKDSISLEQLIFLIKTYDKDWHEQEKCMEQIAKMEDSYIWAKEGYEAVNAKIYAKKYIPSISSEHDSAYDLKAMLDNSIVIAPGKIELIPTGVHISLPVGWGLCVRPRSGLAVKNQVFAITGTVDNGYRGDIGVMLYNSSNIDYTVNDGDRIAQLVLEKIYRIKFLEVNSLEELGNSKRNSNGFGSSGK